MKKIFVLTGEPSGDKLASKVVNNLQTIRSDVDYLSVGGEHLKSLNIKSIYDLKDITYLGFTRVFMNIFKIKRKINQTVNAIIKFNPEVLFSVDSPDFTLRVAEKVKKINPNIKTIHFVAPQVWVWRSSRVKKIKKYIDHILLLFSFEKKFFDKENISSTFVGHPLLDKTSKDKFDLDSVVKKDSKIISIFPGSRLSEINVLMPILLDFVKLSQPNYINFTYIFHSTTKYKNTIRQFILDSKLTNCEVISDISIKQNILNKTTFAITKSGTISLEICNSKIPSIVVYKMNFINFFIIKILIKVKYANIVNIIANAEVIPELLQSKCNSTHIYKVFKNFIDNPSLISKQINDYAGIIDGIKTKGNASKNVANILNENLN
jgi:lipid-A-disaccharide synthase